MITISIANGPTLTTNFTSGMNAQQALEQAYKGKPSGTFTFGVQYYGSTIGKLVLMINESYESFTSKYIPFFFWEFFVNGQIATKGIDQTMLNDGDVVTFKFTTYNSSANQSSTTHLKYQWKIQ